ncbi:phosphonate ABC transporter ATP-binding protein [Psychrobacillus psychrodurans]|uniref:Phosphonate ABC transporter ATP-binding protein n=1 Tax=Psychrobacillus psychrodurans TaxID=126157 RepID=A0A9X3LBA4_9BACI|nr:phosphonate ABC transporter ATP-binding protein [Psychrobacillus psychrodurans]MCZ8534748.1 phosphonate ABC transporter ATP-binding protein [Psychrobacillus psychrodurans]MCZ8540682.1 phosphonate ABC transporter ATP-binding protein [Psychrobacillus psychrodurans]SFM73068.1 phosphonate transport system ATP-binding protein [Psychrobacillus psychrodurans]
MSLLKVEKLGKSYNADAKVLNDVSFEVEAGEFVSIIGPSGAGKSTLLRCINRMVEIDEGKVIFDGNDVGSLNKKELRKMRTNIGMIFQHYNLVPRLSVIENVLHGRFGYKTTVQGILGKFTEDEKEQAFYLLKKLGIEEHAYKRCDQLSGGQQQRVGIARSLIQEPKIVLCDEPIASLDPNASKVIMDYLKSITMELNITCIVNLHQVEIARSYSDRIIGLSKGGIVFDGPSYRLSTDSTDLIYGTKTVEKRQLVTV